MARSKVIVTDHWRQYRREMEREIEKSLAEAAVVAVGVAREKPSKYNISSIREKIKAFPVVRGPFGLEVTIKDTDFRAVFMEKGTYQKLGRRLTARSKEGAEGNRGVRPQRYMAAGKRAGRKALIELLNHRLG